MEKWTSGRLDSHVVGVVLVSFLFEGASFIVATDYSCETRRIGGRVRGNVYNADAFSARTLTVTFTVAVIVIITITITVVVVIRIV